MALLMKHERVYLSGWLGQSGLAWELILDPEWVDGIWIWHLDQAANCPEAIVAVQREGHMEIPEGEVPGENITINLRKYFLGDIVYSLMDDLDLPGPYSVHLAAIRADLTTLRSNIRGLMEDGVIIRLQMRHDLERHCDDGGACFWDKVRYRWVCLE